MGFSYWFKSKLSLENKLYFSFPRYNIKKYKMVGWIRIYTDKKLIIKNGEHSNEVILDCSIFFCFGLSYKIVMLEENSHESSW